MRIAIVSIGSELLLGDVLDTNVSRMARRLLETRFHVACIMTIGDVHADIVDVLRLASQRFEVVLTTGGMGWGETDFTRQAVAELTNRPLLLEPAGMIKGAVVLGRSDVPASGLLLEGQMGVLICLPGDPREAAFLLESAVLPYLQQRRAADTVSSWVLLRTAGLMESTLEQQLADLSVEPHQRVTFSSFAGQTDIRLWAEAESRQQVDLILARLKKEVTDRLGDHVYGAEDARLETIVLRQLARGNVRLAVAECYTNHSLARLLRHLPEAGRIVTLLPVNTEQELASALGMGHMAALDDLTRWCRAAAERLLEKTDFDLSLIIYNNVTSGGIQLLVTLASTQGVSVMQRSFGGHPENISHWATTLGLVHVRRWLLAHLPENLAD